NGGYPRYLLNQAKDYGEATYRLVESILKPHAYLNCRRVQGVLGIMKKYSKKPFYEEVCGKTLKSGVKLPRTFKAMLQAEEKQLQLDIKIGISDLGRQMIRDASYYLN
ncbi:hypothetical protein LCGC14_3132000, partial [marine sediment metagenome]